LIGAFSNGSNRPGIKVRSASTSNTRSEGCRDGADPEAGLGYFEDLAARLMRMKPSQLIGVVWLAVSGLLTTGYSADVIPLAGVKPEDTGAALENPGMGLGIALL